MYTGKYSNPFFWPQLGYIKNLCLRGCPLTITISTGPEVCFNSLSFPHRVTLLSCRRPSEAHQTRQSPWWNKRNEAASASDLCCLGISASLQMPCFCAARMYRIFTYIYHKFKPKHIKHKLKANPISWQFDRNIYLDFPRFCAKIV